MTLRDRLGEYPGRGLLLHRDGSGRLGWVYFVTGRSDASRRRTVRSAGDALLVVPTGEVRPHDALRHYACARLAGDRLVVGNGDHVDAVARCLEEGTDVGGLVASLEPEPDPPLCTPRLCAVVGGGAGGGGGAVGGGAVGGGAVGGGATVVTVHRAEGRAVRRAAPVARRRAWATLVTTYDGSRARPRGVARMQEYPEARPFDAVVDDLWGSLEGDLRVLAVAGRGADLAHPVVRAP